MRSLRLTKMALAERRLRILSALEIAVSFGVKALLRFVFTKNGMFDILQGSFGVSGSVLEFLIGKVRVLVESTLMVLHVD